MIVKKVAGAKRGAPAIGRSEEETGELDWAVVHVLSSLALPITASAYTAANDLHWTIWACTNDDAALPADTSTCVLDSVA